VITDHGVIEKLARLANTENDLLRAKLAQAIGNCCDWAGDESAVLPFHKSSFKMYELHMQVLKLFRLNQLYDRVATWYIFGPKIAIWVHLGRSCNGRVWYTLWTFGLLYGHLICIFYGHLVYLVVIWYI
jgi:hypothetical protein